MARLKRTVIHFVKWILLLTPFQSEAGDPVSQQLPLWKQQHPVPERCTDFNGIPFPSLIATLAVGTDGPVLLQDRALLERTQSFNRERIPERVVHAKGSGAYGVFTVTHDVRHWTKAKFLNQVGKRTQIVLRFSGTSGEVGFPDTIRDARGFAIKFKTEDGNFDIVGNQLEIFNIRDPMLFPDVNKSRKRNPQTHLRDPNMFWDFIQQRPETTHHILKVFSDIGQPESFRMINGSGVHTFKLVNDHGEAVYCKFHFISHQQFQPMSNERATLLAGTDPGHFQRDLYNAIASGNLPRWTMAVQVATFSQAESYRWDFLDITKNWRLEDFPLHQVGVLELNRNFADFFTENEMSAFSPSNMVPGIEPSPDRMLHARMFMYPDAQLYRLGVNYNQLPINRPLNKVANYERDGLMCTGDNGAGGPNYFPNSFNGPQVDPTVKEHPFFVDGDVLRVDTRDADNFSQATLYIERDISREERQRIATNIGHALAAVTALEVRDRVFQNNLVPVSREFAQMVRAAMEFKLRHPTPKIEERS